MSNQLIAFGCAFIPAQIAKGLRPLALGVYAPLDRFPLIALMTCIFFLPVVLHLLSSLRKRPGDAMCASEVPAATVKTRSFYLTRSRNRMALKSSLPWRIFYAAWFVALMVFVLLFILNPPLDKSPRSDVRVTVIRKELDNTGRFGPHYYLVVSSWRPGRNSENLRVASRVFEHAVVGKSVTVELRKGYFGLPWYGNVSPE
jgi:hypothetical protein